MLAVTVALLAGAGCSAGTAARPSGRSSSTSGTQQAGGAPAVPPTAAQPCGTGARPPARYDHVVWIVLENHSYSEEIGTDQAPYTTALAGRCGSATNFHAEARPSLPNYVAMTSGGTQGITDDGPPADNAVAVDNIFAQLGDRWRALQESMPQACSRDDAGQYAVKHNPAVYYRNVEAACARQDVALTTPPDLSAAFTFITPDLCHDTHDCPIPTGDAWLAATLPLILDSPQYATGRTAVFLTWDEPADDDAAGNIPTLVIAPSVPAGTMVADRLDHYSMLRTTQEMLGLPRLLGAAVGAPSMRPAFRL
ncbi:MAG: alkaline phosphatase family protein [Actinomycetota bacterium]|nr:alkaline phosphatase family protein [Actinomycetota bacterium]